MPALPGCWCQVVPESIKGLLRTSPGQVSAAILTENVFLMLQSLLYRLQRQRCCGPWGPPCWCLGPGLLVWLFIPALSTTSGSSVGSWCTPSSSPSSAVPSLLPAQTPMDQLLASWSGSCWGYWQGSLPWASPPSSATQPAPWWTGPTASSSPLKPSLCFSPWAQSLLFHTWPRLCFRETSSLTAGMFAISWGEPASSSPCSRWRNRRVCQLLH